MQAKSATYPPTGYWRRNLKPAGLARSSCQSTTSGNVIFRRSERARSMLGPDAASAPPPRFTRSPSPFRGGTSADASTRSHSEHAELRALGDRRVQRCGEGEAEHVAGLGGVDDTIVPQPRCRVPRIALRLVIVADRLLEGFSLLRRPFVSVAVDGREHGRSLFTAHHADARIGPGEQEARRVS